MGGGLLGLVASPGAAHATVQQQLYCQDDESDDDDDGNCLEQMCQHSDSRMRVDAVTDIGMQKDILADLSTHVNHRPHLVGMGWDAGNDLADQIESHLRDCDQLWTERSDSRYDECVEVNGSAEIRDLLHQQAEGHYTERLVHGTLSSMVERVRMPAAVSKDDSASGRSIDMPPPNPWGVMAETLEDFLYNPMLRDGETSSSKAASSADQQLSPWLDVSALLHDPSAGHIEHWYQRLLRLYTRMDAPRIAHYMEDRRRSWMADDVCNGRWDFTSWYMHLCVGNISTPFPPFLPLLHAVCSLQALQHSLLSNSMHS